MKTPSLFNRLLGRQVQPQLLSQPVQEEPSRKQIIPVIPILQPLYDRFQQFPNGEKYDKDSDLLMRLADKIETDSQLTALAHLSDRRYVAAIQRDYKHVNINREGKLHILDMDFVRTDNRPASQFRSEIVKHSSFCSKDLHQGILTYIRGALWTPYLSDCKVGQEECKDSTILHVNIPDPEERYAEDIYDIF